MKLVQHQETEYDFALEYDAPLPIKVGEYVASGITDGRGVTHHFSGTAVVVATQYSQSTAVQKRFTVYVQTFPIIR